MSGQLIARKSGFAIRAINDFELADIHMFFHLRSNTYRLIATDERTLNLLKHTLRHQMLIHRQQAALPRAARSIDTAHGNISQLLLSPQQRSQANRVDWILGDGTLRRRQKETADAFSAKNVLAVVLDDVNGDALAKLADEFRGGMFAGDD